MLGRIPFRVLNFRDLIQEYAETKPPACVAAGVEVFVLRFDLDVNTCGDWQDFELVDCV